MKKSIIHVINMGSIGGVQEMFIPFYKKALHASYFEHVVFGFEATDSLYAEKVSLYVLKNSFVNCVRFLKYLFLRDSIVHFHNMLGRRGIRALLRIVPVRRVVFTEHGSIWNAPHRDMEVFRSNAARALKVIANSNATKTMLVKRAQIDSDKIEVIHNGYLEECESGKYSENRQKIVVGFIGRFEAFKGIHVLIDAAKKLTRHDISFLIAGTGQYEKVLRERADGCDAIRFVGRVQNPLDFLRTLDILVVPSIREPLGNVIIEAGFCRKAVIAACVDGIPEIIENDKTGILLKPTVPIDCDSFPLRPEYVVDPETQELIVPKQIASDSLKDAILELAQDPAKAQRLGDALFEKVTRDFTLETYFAKIEAMYKGLCVR
jgi:glycosyltransferase involved in cell wall biosynthesis